MTSPLRHCWRNPTRGGLYCKDIGEEGHALGRVEGSAPKGFLPFRPSKRGELATVEQEVDAGEGVSGDGGGCGGGGGASASSSEGPSMGDFTPEERVELEALRAKGKFLIGRIEEDKDGSKEYVIIYWLGYKDPTRERLDSLPQRLRDAWTARHVQDKSRLGRYNTALYVAEKPPGMFGTRVNARHFNLFDESAYQDRAESNSVFGEGDSCGTEKDRFCETHARTMGMFLAVTNCGIIIQARELWRRVPF